MLDNIIQIIKEHAGDVLNNNPSVPADKREAVINTTAQSVQESLQSQAGSGGIGAITSMFNSGTSDASALSGTSSVNNISNHLAENLMKKVGIDQGTASKIASTLIPLVMSKFINKANDPNDNSISKDGILGALTGGSAGGVADKLKGFF